MTENEGNSKAGPEKKKTLTLRGGGLSQGTVRQNFSHGRTKSVVVETRKRRIVKPGEAPSTPASEKPAEAAESPATDVPSNLSKSEVEARARALEEAKVRDVEDAKRRVEEEKRQAEEDARRSKEREEAAKLKAEEDERLAAEREAVERERAAEASAVVAKAEDGGKPLAREEAKPKELKPFERKKPDEPPKPSRPKGGDDRRRTKLTLSNALDEDGGSRGTIPCRVAQASGKAEARRATTTVRTSRKGSPRSAIARDDYHSGTCRQNVGTFG